MRQITTDQLTALLSDHTPPCVSLYQSTHRRFPDNQQDPIRFRNLLSQMEESLERSYPGKDLRGLIEKFRPLARDDSFWNHRTEGLAILASPETFQVFELQRAVPELLVVADSFHIKPLVRSLQALDRFQILGLNRHEAKLFEGNRIAVDEIELAAGVPRTIEAALGSELTDPHLTEASYGGAGGRGSAHAVPSMHHGSGQKKDEVEIDEERFFRVIDRAILEHHSRPSGLPLILAALPEHHDLFRKVSHNPLLIDEGIRFDPSSISADRLREEAWSTIEPRYRQRLATLCDNFAAARSKQLGSADVADVAQALVAGRVGTLMVENDRQIPGRIDRETGRIEFGGFDQPRIDDLLDDLAELTLKMGGEVVIVPVDQMPTKSGIAATYRF